MPEKMPDICPYCGKKLLHFLTLSLDETGEIASRECKRCKVKWVLTIDPKVLSVTELRKQDT